MCEDLPQMQCFRAYTFMGWQGIDWFNGAWLCSTGHGLLWLGFFMCPLIDWTLCSGPGHWWAAWLGWLCPMCPSSCSWSPWASSDLSFSWAWTLQGFLRPILGTAFVTFVSSVGSQVQGVSKFYFASFQGGIVKYVNTGRYKEFGGVNEIYYRWREGMHI